MKLNLDFSLYKGVTKLKQWYKEVKAHFTQVQEAHNALEDTVEAESGKLSTEITQRTNADIALSDRINAEANTRSSADAALGQRITTEENARTESDNEIKASIAQMRADYFGDGSMLTFEWTGEVPNARFVSEDSCEPCVDVDLSGMFELDGVPCGTMTETEILLNYVENNNGEVTSFNNGVTYIIASFNTKTQEIEVTWSDEYEETSVTDNICRFTAARYYIETQANSSGGYSFIANSGTPYKVSATVSKAALMDKVEQNSKAISALQDNINLETTTRETADAALEEKINYIISLRPSDREIFVMCDGDHDELKIQAALNTVKTGGVVYPYPKDSATVVTLSNTNTIASYVRNYTSVIKIPNYITLDFKYCAETGLKFINSNPGTNQILFDLQSNAIMLNMPVIDFDSETVTSTSDNPTLIYTGAYARVEDCDLSGYAGTNNTSTSVYGVNIGANSKFVGNTISGTEISKLTGNMRMYNFGGYTLVENNTFTSITLPNATTGGGIEGYLFYFTSCTLRGNKFSNIDFKGRRFVSTGTTALWSENDFYKITDVSFTLSGIIKYCTFRAIVGNWDDYTFSFNAKSIMTKNKFLGISQPRSDCENALFFASANDHIVISDNQMIDVSTCANVPLFDLDYSGYTQLKDNYIYYSAPNENTKVVSADNVSGCEIKNNTTNAVSIGTFDSTCVVEGNIVGFGA